jgi:HPt (histidine-containing phosphotransfer) domain-containing protein
MASSRVIFNNKRSLTHGSSFRLHDKERIVIQCKTKALFYYSLTLRQHLGRQFASIRDFFRPILKAPYWMSVPRTLDGFDVTAAIGRMLDQPMLWWQAVGLFVEHFADWEQAWQESVGDYAREQKRVHALRSAAANVGATVLAATAADLEKQLLKCLAGQPIVVPDSLRRDLQQAFRQTWHAAAEAWKAATPTSQGRVP